MVGRRAEGEGGGGALGLGFQQSRQFHLAADVPFHRSASRDERTNIDHLVAAACIFFCDNVSDADCSISDERRETRDE